MSNLHNNMLSIIMIFILCIVMHFVKLYNHSDNNSLKLRFGTNAYHLT